MMLLELLVTKSMGKGRVFPAEELRRVDGGCAPPAGEL